MRWLVISTEVRHAPILNGLLYNGCQISVWRSFNPTHPPWLSLALTPPSPGGGFASKGEVAPKGRGIGCLKSPLWGNYELEEFPNNFSSYLHVQYKFLHLISLRF